MYVISENWPAFTCPCCHAVMRSPLDIAQRYCGRCHWYTGDDVLGPGHLEAPCEARTEAMLEKFQAAIEANPDDGTGGS